MKIHFNRFLVLLVVAISAFATSSALAATYCVSNSNSLQSALNQAEADGEDSEVRIEGVTMALNPYSASQCFESAITRGGKNVRASFYMKYSADNASCPDCLFYESLRSKISLVFKASLTKQSIPNLFRSGKLVHIKKISFLI